MSTSDPRSQGPSPRSLSSPRWSHRATRPGWSRHPDFGEGSYVGHGRLQVRVAIVTEADSGIGRALALAFSREGADVLVSYLDEHEDAAESQRVVEASGRRAVLMSGDIGDDGHCRALIERAMDEFGRVDILVTKNAVQKSKGSVQDTTGKITRKITRGK